MDTEKNSDEELLVKELQSTGNKVIELEETLKYVAKFFIYHADQRLKTFRYFLFYLVAVSAGFYTVYINGDNLFLAAGSIVSLAITIVFWLLEGRNKQLVKIGSDACQLMEKELVKCLPRIDENGRTITNNVGDRALYYANLKIVTRADGEREEGLSYRSGIRVLFVISVILHAIILSLALDNLNFFKNFKTEKPPIEVRIVE